MTIILRETSPADEDAALKIVDSCMRDYAVATFGAFDEARARESFRPGITQFIERDRRLAGLLCVFEEPGHIQLEQLLVLPESQRQGIGTRLVRDVVERARAAGKPLRLRVLAVNPAKRLYEREGFVVTEATPERYFMEWRG